MGTPNPNLLLSKELQAKVVAKLKECIAIAEAKYERKFEMPEIRWDIKNTDGGRANYREYLVRFNLILCVENEQKFLDTTVPHEFGHLVNYIVNYDACVKEGRKLRPHGKEWKAVMEVLKTPPKVTHSYDCTSIQKPKRRKRGSKLRGAEADLLLHRLTIAAKRLPVNHLGMLIELLLSHEEDTKE